MAPDDLVEALARQRAAAEVDEQPRLDPLADQLRAAAAQVVGHGARGGAADRHQPLLRALAPREHDAVDQVDLAHVEVDRLRRAQAARVHQLQQRAVAQRDRVGALRLLQQALHLRAAQHARQLAAPARRGSCAVGSDSRTPSRRR